MYSSTAESLVSHAPFFAYNYRVSQVAETSQPWLDRSFFIEPYPTMSYGGRGHGLLGVIERTSSRASMVFGSVLTSRGGFLVLVPDGFNLASVQMSYCRVPWHGHRRRRVAGWSNRAACRGGQSGGSYQDGSELHYVSCVIRVLYRVLPFCLGNSDDVCNSRLITTNTYGVPTLHFIYWHLIIGSWIRHCVLWLVSVPLIQGRVSLFNCGLDLPNALSYSFLLIRSILRTSIHTFDCVLPLSRTLLVFSE